MKIYNCVGFKEKFREKKDIYLAINNMTNLGERKISVVELRCIIKKKYAKI